MIGGDRGLAPPIPGGPPDPGDPPEGCASARAAPTRRTAASHDPPLREVAPAPGAACHFAPWSEWPELDGRARRRRADERAR